MFRSVWDEFDEFNSFIFCDSVHPVVVCAKYFDSDPMEIVSYYLLPRDNRLKAPINE